MANRRNSGADGRRWEEKKTKTQTGIRENAAKLRRTG